MPSVGPGFAPVSTWTGKASSPASVSVTGSRLKVRRPGASSFHNGVFVIQRDLSDRSERRGTTIENHPCPGLEPDCCASFALWRLADRYSITIALMMERTLRAARVREMGLLRM